MGFCFVVIVVFTGINRKLKINDFEASCGTLALAAFLLDLIWKTGIDIGRPDSASRVHFVLFPQNFSPLPPSSPQRQEEYGHS